MFTVAGYQLDPDHRYDPETNLWVAADGRVGYDPLGAQTAGDIVAISFAPVGAAVARGEPVATVEAAKFVGPLPAPVGGTLAAVNERALAAPASVNADPLAVWLVKLAEIEPADLDRLVCGRDAIAAWFTQAAERFRREGVIAE